MTALDEVKIGGLGLQPQAGRGRRGSSAAAATTSTTSRCPACCTWRSCAARVAHARIKSIDTSKAWEIPGVRLVLTGEMAAQRNLAWMPTLSYDTQAVLATDKVRFQGQEVACVVADDPYIAKDGCEADRRRVRAAAGDRQPGAGAGPGRPADPRRQGGADRQRLLPLGGRRQGGHRPGVRPGRRGLEAEAALPALAPVADRVLRLDRRLRPGDREADRLHDHAGAAHHPRGGGARGRAARAHDPDHLAGHRRRVRQQGAGLPGLRLLDPVLDPARQAGEVDRGQVRQPDLHRVRAATCTSTASWRCAPTARSSRVRFHADTDQGAFFSDAQPSKFKIGLVHSAFACYDIPVGHITARGAYTNKAPGGVAYRCSFRVTEAMFFQERIDRRRRRRPRHGPRRVPPAQPRARRPVPATARAFGFLIDSGQYQKCLDIGLDAIGYDAVPEGQGGRAPSAGACWASASPR